MHFFFMSEEKDWVLCFFGGVFMGREGHDFTVVD